MMTATTAETIAARMSDGTDLPTTAAQIAAFARAMWAPKHAASVVGYTMVRIMDARAALTGVGCERYSGQRDDIASHVAHALTAMDRAAHCTECLPHTGERS